jgi:hypothetical protein
MDITNNTAPLFVGSGGPMMTESVSTDSSYELCHAPNTIPIQGSGSQTLTRVISPTHPALAMIQSTPQQGGQLTLPRYDERNSAIVPSVQAQCVACHQMATEPSICASCGNYGHAQCMRMAVLEGYSFCGPCLPRVQHDYDQAFRR